MSAVSAAIWGLAGLAALAFLAGLWRLRKGGLTGAQEAHLRKICLSLVLKAEALYASGEGQAKLADVLSRVYPALPPLLALLLPPRTVERVIELAVQDMKAFLAEKPRGA